MDSALYQLHAEIEDRHWWFRARREILATVIATYLPKGDTHRLIEFGCGTGGNLPMLAHFGNVVGCEPSAEAAALARWRTGLDVERGELPELPDNLPGSVDVVGLFDVLEHIDDDRAALQAASQLLDRHGLAVITVPAHQWMWSAHDERFGHRRRYSHVDLLQLLDDCQLQVLHSTYFCSLTFPAVATVRLLGRLLGRRDAHDLAVPPAPLNELLRRAFVSEARWVPHRRCPVGSSLLAVASPRRSQ